tara:strand:- start:10302 stop:10559 length:258 start_codon:yes stop_codon:yes gene_type:complete
MARSKSRSSKKGSSNFGAKALAAVIAALLFAVVSLPQVYKLTNSIPGPTKKKLAVEQGKNVCPTGLGIAVHSVVFGLLVLLVMEL